MDLNLIIQYTAMLIGWMGSLGALVWALVTFINGQSTKLHDRIEEVRRDLQAKVEEQDRKRSDNVVKLYTAISEATESLDGKFNTIRAMLDSVKDTYVRRDDLERHLQRWELAARDQTEATNRLRSRVDDVLAKLVEFIGREDRRREAN